MSGWTLLIAVHAAGATLAVVLGGCQLARRRKGDLLHRRIGRLWLADMYWVALSSFGIRRMNPGSFSWIHGLSLFTILSLSLALWAARRGDVRAHRRWATGSYLGLLGAGIAASVDPTRLVPQAAIHAPWLLLGVLLGLTGVAAACIQVAARVRTGTGAAPAPARTPAGRTPAVRR
jgi:uncharacterized membrane protein